MVGPRITARANPRIKEIGKLLDLDAGDMRAMTTKMDMLFRKNEKRLFATEGSSGGVKWKPLKKATLDAKKRKGLSSKIMQRTGRLRKGLTAKGHGDHIAKWSGLGSKARIKIGVQSILPVYHGAVRGRRKNPKLPRRSVFQMTIKQRRGYYQVLFNRFDLKRKRFMRALAAGAATMRAGLNRGN